MDFWVDRHVIRKEWDSKSKKERQWEKREWIREQKHEGVRLNKIQCKYAVFTGPVAIFLPNYCDYTMCLFLRNIVSQKTSQIILRQWLQVSNLLCFSQLLKPNQIFQSWLFFCAKINLFHLCSCGAPLICDMVCCDVHDISNKVIGICV